ncbi:glycoside hydrolase family 88 protein [Tenggerimyces flavus]|uniref:Glycoside hydrolase family 88 protein n=1 Tax=Tenggerimyces flavus TaxID=1708749 RepID=A0ABV7YKG4_9ACTN|nr:glycoside hydrolase family 88 protein [Tenggerimyces flavus]MBM7789703.1 unsaturated chondroitin disaccharide hydrolase [Tenggerimyces flavus]
MSDQPYAAAIEAMTGRIDRTAEEAATGFPHYADPTTGQWTRSPDGDWTGGFWGGELWLAYHRTGDEAYRRHALRWAERLRPRVASQTVFRGFLFYYGSALGALLGSDETAGAIAVDGARALATGFLPTVGAIPLGAQAEEASDVGDTEFNIDGVPGVALLAWAASRTADPGLRELAVSHARRHIELCVRGDGSVCQSATVDLATGKVLKRYTHKGFSDDSTWTRAQAWAMVGYALAARWLPEDDFLDTLVRVCDWWCDHLPASGVTYWDFDAPQIAGTRIDTAGAAIGAAALLKAAALVPDESRAQRYRATAEQTVRTLVADHLTSTGILTAGCYNHRIGLATDNELIWGSYYLYESLHVLTGALDPLAV